MRRLLFAIAIIAAGAPAVARSKMIPAATPTGDPADCVQLNQVRQTYVRSDQVIDFELTGNRVYRNTLASACPSLGFEERFVYTVSNGELCSVDTITVLQSTGGRGATCGLGKFQPVVLAK